jgi:hypothetical protein
MQGSVSALASGCPNNHDAAYFATTGGQIFVRSTAGKSFQQTNWGKPNSPPGEAPVMDPRSAFDQRIEIDPDDYQVAYVLDSNGNVWVTIDTGISWFSITYNLLKIVGKPNGSTPPVDSVEIYDPMPNGKLGDEVLLVGGLGGVYRLFNPLNLNGGTWSLFGTGLPNVLVSGLHYINGSADILVAGTFGRGAWTVPQASATMATPVSLRISGGFIRLVTDPNPSFLDVFVDNNTNVPNRIIPFAILPGIEVYGQGNSTSLEVDDANDGQARNATVDSITINGLIPVPITYQGLSTMTVTGGRLGSTITSNGSSLRFSGLNVLTVSVSHLDPLELIRRKELGLPPPVNLVTVNTSFGDDNVLWQDVLGQDELFNGSQGPNIGIKGLNSGDTFQLNQSIGNHQVAFDDILWPTLINGGGAGTINDIRVAAVDAPLTVDGQSSTTDLWLGEKFFDPNAFFPGVLSGINTDVTVRRAGLVLDDRADTSGVIASIDSNAFTRYEFVGFGLQQLPGVVRYDCTLTGLDLKLAEADNHIGVLDTPTPPRRSRAAADRLWSRRPTATAAVRCPSSTASSRSRSSTPTPIRWRASPPTSPSTTPVTASTRSSPTTAATRKPAT